MLVLIQYLPFWGIMLLANWAEHKPTARILVYLSLALSNTLLLLGALFSILFQQLAGQAGRQAHPALADLLALLPANYAHVAAALAITSLLGFTVLLPPARRLLARRLPIAADSALDCVALTFAIYFVGLTALEMLLLGGVEGLALIEISLSTWDLLLGGLALVIFALLGVGWGLRRNTSEALQRLGLERMRAGHWLLAPGLVAAFLLFDIAVSLAWSALDPAGSEQVSNAAKALFGGMTDLSLAIPLALATGIGEEMLFRGAVQPRLGLWLTSAVFALGHLQYGLSPALLEVLALGLVLGLVRQRANTTTCIVIHALYNLANLFVMAWLSQLAA